MRKGAKSFRETYENMPISSITVSQLASDIREMVRFGDPDFEYAMHLWDAFKNQCSSKTVTGDGAVAATTVDLGPAENKAWIIKGGTVKHDDGANPTVAFRLTDGTTPVWLCDPEAANSGARKVLQEVIPSILPIPLSYGGYFQFYSSIAAGKKITYELAYDEYDVL